MSQQEQAEEIPRVPAETFHRTTVLEVTFVGLDAIGVNYKTMPGNQPNSYGNYLAIWQNENSIPWSTDPLRTQRIGTNSPNGDTVFHGIGVTNNSYLIAYGVGPELTGKAQKRGNLCATDFIPAAGAPSEPTFSTKLVLTQLGSRSVTVRYRFPSGNLPLSNGAWIGIWFGRQASYVHPPLGASCIRRCAANGDASIGGIDVQRHQAYTIALFASGWGTDFTSNDQRVMACSLSFTSS